MSVDFLGTTTRTRENGRPDKRSRRLSSQPCDSSQDQVGDIIDSVNIIITSINPLNNHIFTHMKTHVAPAEYVARIVNTLHQHPTWFA